MSHRVDNVRTPPQTYSQCLSQRSSSLCVYYFRTDTTPVCCHTVGLKCKESNYDWGQTEVLADVGVITPMIICVHVSVHVCVCVSVFLSMPVCCAPLFLVQRRGLPAHFVLLSSASLHSTPLFITPSICSAAAPVLILNTAHKLFSSALLLFHPP